MKKGVLNEVKLLVTSGPSPLTRSYVGVVVAGSAALGKGESGMLSRTSSQAVVTVGRC